MMPLVEIQRVASNAFSYRISALVAGAGPVVATPTAAAATASEVTVVTPREMVRCLMRMRPTQVPTATVRRALR